MQDFFVYHMKGILFWDFLRKASFFSIIERNAALNTITSRIDLLIALVMTIDIDAYYLLI